MPHEGQRGQCNYRALALVLGPWCALNCFIGGRRSLATRSS